MASSRYSHPLRRDTPGGRWRGRGVSVVAAFLLAVAGSLFVAPTAQALVVNDRGPVPGSEVVAVDTNVTATFDEVALGVSESTFTLQSIGGASVPAVVTGGPLTWTLDPNGSLQPGTTYTATLTSGITDAAMVAFAGDSWSFTTDAPPGDTTAPTVTARDPGNGDLGVGVARSVFATFSEDVQGVDETTFTLRAGAADVAANVVPSGVNRWVLNPLDALQPGTQYTVRLTGGPAAIRDQAGNALADTSWVFRTAGDAGEPGGDVRDPRVTDRAPRPGATGVAVDGVVTVTFNESVQGVDESTFVLERGSFGNEVPAIVFRRGDSNRWTLSPDDNLRRNTRYTVLLFGGPGEIRDLAGNPLADTEWSFSTRNRADDNFGPEVVSRSPRPGASGVSRRTDLRVTFSESVRRVNEDTFVLTDTRTGRDVGGFVFRSRDFRHWALDPDRTLRRGTRYEVTLQGGRFGITDLDGNRLRSTTWSFRTGR